MTLIWESDWVLVGFDLYLFLLGDKAIEITKKFFGLYQAESVFGVDGKELIVNNN